MSQPGNTGQAGKPPESNFMQLRWWFFAIAAAAGVWAIAIESNRPSAGACQSIRNITGDTGQGCATPGELWIAIIIAAVSGIMWAAAMLARRS